MASAALLGSLSLKPKGVVPGTFESPATAGGKLCYGMVQGRSTAQEQEGLFKPHNRLPIT